MSTLREDLIAAKALIDTPEKWGKGEFEPRPGCYCAVGAIWKVTDGEGTRYVAPVFALWKVLPGDWTNAAGYNDDPETTHADIMALFDRAIATAEGGAS